MRKIKLVGMLAVVVLACGVIFIPLINNYKTIFTLYQFQGHRILRRCPRSTSQKPRRKLFYIKN